MRIVSWNVNGLRAAWSHGVSSVISKLDADIYLFQETKVSEPFGEIRSDRYHDFWSFGNKKGYSGTLVLSKDKPLDVTYDLGDNGFHDTEGRIITLEYGGFYVVDCYMPNTTGSDKRKDFRELWDEKFYGHLHNLERIKPVIVCGDFNTTVSDDEIYE
ncbi:MAG: endonuclease/exonuclease/phosphatase family protein, partial [Clostridia bacterium]|nr:endonuclease/exonuclease/phosphatase family protein [Clostridia bacterium]